MWMSHMGAVLATLLPPPPLPPHTTLLPLSGLPTEEGRLEILHIHTKVMREHNRLAKEVNLEELAARTKNFTGAEIEGLVRAAQATAMNRLIKVAMDDEVLCC